MTHPDTRTVPCPVCRTPTAVTCHVTTHDGTLDRHTVLFDSTAGCQGEREDGHGPVSDEAWREAWLASHASLSGSDDRQEAR